MGTLDIARQVAPARPDPAAGDGHVVQFYGHEAQLIRQVADFIEPAFAADAAAVIIATGTHRDHLRAELRTRGIDLSTAQRDGRYVTMDAAATLARFMVDGRPDRERFAEVIGTALDRAEASSGRGAVLAYGEMVALLWLAGRPDAALQLEELWNELREQRPFKLLCGYPVQIFGSSPPESASDVARLHGAVLPSERHGLRTAARA